MTSKTFGPETARRPHLVRDGKGGVAGEVGDLRSDVENAVAKMELRTGFPELDWLDGGHAAAAGGDAVLKGRLLLNGQSFASVTLGASLDIIARVPGEAGNDYSVEVIDSAAGGLAVTWAANKLSIDLGGATPDEDTIATAVNNAGVGAPLRANSGGGAAFGTVAETSLTGGAGDGFACRVSGVEAPIKFDTGAATSNANLAEGEVTVTVPDLTAEADARAVGDVVAIEIVSNGLHTKALTTVLA